eukprot:10064656-Ditylum_brightwellii.AAC.1
MVECGITGSVTSLPAAGGVFLVLIKIEEGVTMLILLWYLGLGISEDLLFSLAWAKARDPISITSVGSEMT